ncbi:hypothetical protein A6E05_14370 [Aliivibrio sp. 1S165]|nr:hypothetical protein A6E05_14370 [Aliivibrio sp. 1S165]OCH34455.1 hypothetical protein A6E06_01110 [Aliivibrio sp. 1S175]
MQDKTKNNTKSVITKTMLILFQSLIFMLIYISNNWYAEHQGITRSIITEFDLALPFIEWMIIPYLSSAIYFLLAFFYVNDSKKYQQLNQNMLLAVLISGWCFYLYPLYFGSVELVINYPWELGFDLVYFFDKPYNQAPSLHIIYGILLWFSLFGRLNSTLNWVITVSIALMLVSTLFTYQHRILDVISGVAVAVGVICFTRYYLLSYLSQVYLSLASTCWLLSMILMLVNPILSLLFGYLSIGFGLLFIAYFMNKPYVLGKRRNGTIGMIYLVCLFPYRFVYWFMWKMRSWVDKQPVVSILPWLSVGRRLSKFDEREKFTHVIDLSSELSLMSTLHYDDAYQSDNQYRYLPLLDLQPITMVDAVLFCESIEMIKRNNEVFSVYVHCTMGISRSYAMIASYLVRSGECEPCDVKAYLSTLNPHVMLRECYLDQELLQKLSEYSVEKDKL